MVLLPFDAHNHIHMGPSDPLRASEPFSVSGKDIRLGGMAIMSTHPRDFDSVADISQQLHEQHGIEAVKCFGVHPWFVSELEENWDTDDSTLPEWLLSIEQLLIGHRKAIVGEIGLDGFHFDGNTGDLSAPMETQVKVFRHQMELAARYKRPVSMHAVKCFGVLTEVLTDLKKRKQMPPKIYFHAFGGKLGTVDQLLALCGRDAGEVYFGFAPVVNFRSPKTMDVVRKVGIERLVLETDHEDAAFVPESMQRGIEFIADAVGLSEDAVIEQTTLNAKNLYTVE